MQKQLQFFMGMDVSKLWVDITLMCVADHKRQDMITERFDNNASGLKALHHWLKAHGVSFDDNSLLVIENTGVYHRLIWQYCSQHHLPLYIGNAADIKWSLGITRGKSDKVDSRRLCAYAHKNHEDLRATPAQEPKLTGLKDLMTSRSRLLLQANSIKVYLAELRASNSKEAQALLEGAHQAALEGIKQSIKAVEQQMQSIIKENKAVEMNYKLLLSVPGIGPLTAMYMICCTYNFKIRITGKQLASYAGVAPFGHQSGTSVKGRDKVHKMANKELKKLLHMGALSAISNYEEFRHYYERKVGEGKHQLSVLNAIKSKIVLRAVSVVNNQKTYVNNYKKTA